METYLTMMYITLDQEKALKKLFLQKDLKSTTTIVGPTFITDASVSKKIPGGAEGDVETATDNYINHIDKSTSAIHSVQGDVDSDTEFNDSNGDEKEEQVKKDASKQSSNGYLCSECGKSFQKPQSLKAHLEMHAIETTGSKRPFVCTAENCGKSFSRKTHWLFHMNIHAKRTPFVCEYCGRSYTSRYSHKRHILVCHTGDGGRCSVCGKVILEKDALLAHKTVCYSKSAHRCKQCGAVFKWRSGLRQHKKKHEERGIGVMDKRFDKNCIDFSEKPDTNIIPVPNIVKKAPFQYACLENFKPVQSSVESVEMTNIVHNGDTNLSLTKTSKEYFCKECNKIFKWKQSYSKHRKSKHCEALPKQIDKVEKSGVKQDIVVYYIPEPDKLVNETQLC